MDLNQMIINILPIRNGTPFGFPTVHPPNSKSVVALNLCGKDSLIPSGSAPFSLNLRPSEAAFTPGYPSNSAKGTPLRPLQPASPVALANKIAIPLAARENSPMISLAKVALLPQGAARGNQSRRRVQTGDRGAGGRPNGRPVTFLIEPVS